MDIVNDLLFWLHLSALAMGGAAVFGLPVVGRQIMAATAETRPALFSVANGLSTVARVALVILIVTGPLLIWLKFGSMAGFTWWFTLKMVLVVLLLISVVVAGIQSKKAQRGDLTAAATLPRFSIANLVLLLGIVLAAVFAFN